MLPPLGSEGLEAIPALIFRFGRERENIAETDYFKLTPTSLAKSGKLLRSPRSLVVPLFSMADGNDRGVSRIFSLLHCFQAFSEIKRVSK